MVDCCNLAYEEVQVARVACLLRLRQHRNTCLLTELQLSLPSHTTTSGTLMAYHGLFGQLLHILVSKLV